MLRSSIPGSSSPTPRATATTAATTSRTRERLRQAEEQLEKLRGGRREGSGDGYLTAADRRHRVGLLNRDVQAMSAGPRKSTKGMFKAACSTDLLFLIDTTGSMWSYIDEVKRQVKSIVQDIKEALLNEVEVRIAIVGYRDHGDDPNIESLDFTTSTKAVYAFLDSLRATGGADLPEDVLGGLRAAVGASWKHQSRCIIHIADAPPHGRTLHDLGDNQDTYPNPGSEPHRLSHPALLQQMIKLNLNYTLLRIKHFTDRMIFTFLEAYTAALAECTLLKDNKYHSMACGLASSIRHTSPSSRKAEGALMLAEQELGTSYSELRSLVVKTVTNSSSRTAIRMIATLSRERHDGERALSSMGSITLEAIGEHDADADAAAAEDHPTLEREPPQWHHPGWLTKMSHFEGFSPGIVVHNAKTLNDMMALDEHIKLDVMQLTVHRRPRPFAEGALRQAFYARTAFSTNPFVVKSFKKAKKPLPHLAEDMRCQALCKAFALEFNALVGEPHSIDFVVTTCLQAKTASGLSEECLSLEPFIEGEYVKYNGNNSYVNTEMAGDPTFEAAQAFSHFTYERSCGHFLICDIQGVGRTMTDPAIHAKDPERFQLADTNIGKEGFKFFFATHECNDICRRLELKSSRATLIAGTFEFRERWPTIENTVCCSNKLCGKIVSVSSAHKSNNFPGCHWCNTCWPQLESTTVKWICGAPGPHHEFDISRFYLESQGRVPPRQCPEHSERDVTESRAAVVGGNMLNRLVGITKKKSVSGKDW